MKKLISFAVIALFFAACSSSGDKKTEGEDNAALASITTVELNVEGMTCTGCENTVSESVAAIDGVTECTASFESGKAVVKYDAAKTDVKAIEAAIADAGYKVVEETPAQ